MKKLTQSDFDDAGYTKLNRDKIWSHARAYVDKTDAENDEFTMVV